MNFKVAIGNKRGALICIHGNSSSSNIFDTIVSEYTKYSITLPGHEVDKYCVKENADYSLTKYKEQLISFINALNVPVFLIGNSLGGHLAIEIAHEINALKGLMIFGAPPVEKPINFEEAFLPVEALQTFLTPNPDEAAVLEACKVTLSNQNHLEIVKGYFNDTDPLVRSHTANDIMSGNWSDQRELFVSLKCNKYIIHGLQDPSVNIEYLKKVVNACSIHCELITIDKCGHYPSLEQPKILNTTLSKVCDNVFAI
ncbi:alpha/beta fold hydrolase [Lacinutrix mariniflava]|uniref:alpha/beta fold hydrolase n=1 Tax=Lacinutrix mariniflava TaxID=342955 RepID=UPI0006E1922C|nr:alpha/beta hydrolase [Lacinutrix mariniflava]